MDERKNLKVGGYRPPWSASPPPPPPPQGKVVQTAATVRPTPSVSVCDILYETLQQLADLYKEVARGRLAGRMYHPHRLRMSEVIRSRSVLSSRLAGA
jgi:hypothetical protein